MMTSPGSFCDDNHVANVPECLSWKDESEAGRTGGYLNVFYFCKFVDCNENHNCQS